MEEPLEVNNIVALVACGVEEGDAAVVEIKRYAHPRIGEQMSPDILKVAAKSYLLNNDDGVLVGTVEHTVYPIVVAGDADTQQSDSSDRIDLSHHPCLAASARYKVRKGTGSHPARIDKGACLTMVGQPKVEPQEFEVCASQVGMDFLQVVVGIVGIVLVDNVAYETIG